MQSSEVGSVAVRQWIATFILAAMVLIVFASHAFASDLIDMSGWGGFLTGEYGFCNYETDTGPLPELMGQVIRHYGKDDDERRRAYKAFMNGIERAQAPRAYVIDCDKVRQEYDWYISEYKKMIKSRAQ